MFYVIDRNAEGGLVSIKNTDSIKQALERIQFLITKGIVANKVILALDEKSAQQYSHMASNQVVLEDFLVDTGVLNYLPDDILSQEAQRANENFYSENTKYGGKLVETLVTYSTK